MTFLKKNTPRFCLRQWRRNGIRSGRILLGDNTGGAADRVISCWNFVFNWTPLYLHTQLTIRIAYSIPACTQFVFHRAFRNVTYCDSRRVSAVANNNYARPQVPTAALLRIQIRWWRRAPVCCFLRSSICKWWGVQEEHELTTFLRNVGKHQPIDRVSHRRRPESYNTYYSLGGCNRNPIRPGYMGFKELYPGVP